MPAHRRLTAQPITDNAAQRSEATVTQYLERYRLSTTDHPKHRRRQWYGIREGGSAEIGYR